MTHTHTQTTTKTRIVVERVFSDQHCHPFDEVEWELRTASVGSFEQHNVEFPTFWSQTATNIVAQKYFRGQLDSPERETSLKQVIHRVARTITDWGIDGGYFDGDAQVFEDELMFILLHQYAAFNSPVWFNVGFEEKPQCSACFILSVDDDMSSILDWIRKEGIIFTGGSGSGVNLSKLRSSSEPLSKGGYASGPVSFMRGADASAGTIKSGGKTRRAAKMVILNVDHPDIEEFIWCKANEEKKAHALAAAGFDMSLDSPNWTSIQYQNANNSVRVSDEFMKAAESNLSFDLRPRKGRQATPVNAADLLNQMAEAAWQCADPGIQYDDTINGWHTCPRSGPINASNPCSEYMHLDNSACNLSSINLLKFLTEEDEFDSTSFCHTVDVMILAQEILVGYSSYPTEEITRNAHDFRQLGLGFANLGALLMSCAIPYDSGPARDLAGSLAALMTGQAYAKSAEIAARMGPFNGWPLNTEAMLGVIERHKEAAQDLASPITIRGPQPSEVWGDALASGATYGFRNAQATVIAPTGTISFMMDCDTTGIEPDFSLVKTKSLVGGGKMDLVNQSVFRAMKHLGYGDIDISNVATNVSMGEDIAQYLDPSEVHVFSCAVGPRAIDVSGHLRMMAAVQPFISGAISKTVNVPENTTVEQIAQIFQAGWKLGLKSIAVYRDNCKVTQPLSSKKIEVKLNLDHDHPRRTHLPEDRTEVGRKFQVGDYEGYIHVGLYPDGNPGDIFVDIAKEGTTLAGLINALMISVSLGLQYGVPLEVYVKKFAHMRFEPAGLTNDADIRQAKSLVDYIFRWMGKKFLSVDLQSELGIMSPAVKERLTQSYSEGQSPESPTSNQADAVVCSRCSGKMLRTGSCYTCTDCGMDTGCAG